MYSRMCSNCPSQATTFLTAHAEEGGGTDGILEYVPKEKVTLPKTNMAPENRPLEKELPIGNHHFQGLCQF